MPGPWPRIKSLALSVRRRFSGRDPGPPDPRAERFLRLLGPALLAVAILLQAVFLLPEIRLEQTPIHDGTLHVQLSHRLVEAVRDGENPLDCWVQAFTMGYPVWRTYQPLPHWITAAFMAAASPFAEGVAVYALLVWLILCLYPPAFYIGSRLLGLSPAGAGAAALLCLAVSSPGSLPRWGLGYGAFVWRGSGVYTQMWALPLLVLSLGAVAWALRSGRRLTRAGLAVAATGLCHIVFGYAASLSALLLALLPQAPGSGAPLRRRLFRLTWIGLVVLTATAFLVIPALQDLPWVNHSRFEKVWKWDSVGAARVLGHLLRGEMLDAHRLPVLSLLFLAGLLGAVFRRREAAARTLLALTALWLLLYFGRATWGTLTRVLLVSENLHMHRFQAAFETCAVLVAAFGVDTLFRRPALRRSLVAAGAAAAGLALVLLPVMRERADFLSTGVEWGRIHQADWVAAEEEKEALVGQLQERLASAPGRVFAGFKRDWGGRFRIGSAPFYTVLAQAGIDCSSYLFHSMSLPADPMLRMDEWSTGNLRQMGIRYLVAPEDREVNPSLKQIGLHGRFALYELEAGDAGYFGLVTAPARCEGSPEDRFQCAVRWLASDMPDRGQVVDWGGPHRPGQVLLDPSEPVPEELAALPVPAGSLSGAAREGQVYRVSLDLPEAGTLLFRMSYHPGWRATVDGEPVPTRMVVPGFTVIAPAGSRPSCSSPGSPASSSSAWPNGAAPPSGWKSAGPPGPHAPAAHWRPRPGGSRWPPWRPTPARSWWWRS